MNRQRTISLLVVLFVATVMMLPTIAGAATSTRTLPASVEPGAEFTVSVSAADYGAIGSVVETIPAGFTYVSSTLDEDIQVDSTGNPVIFNLMGESSFDYTVTASDTEGTYTFSGIIKDVDLAEFAIADSSINVVAAGVVPASAIRTLPASVAPGATVTVSMTAADYGAIGSIVETIPAGFTYVSSTLDEDIQVDSTGNPVIFNLMGESSFDYTVTASDTDGTYTFSGIIKNVDLAEFAIADSSIAVTSEPPTPASAERTHLASVEPSATVIISMTVADYGAIGSVIETIPAGFTYVSSTLDEDTQVDSTGNPVVFNLMGESSFDYTVVASATDGTYTFSGIIKNEDLMEYAITDTSIVVLPPVMDVPLHEGWDFISIPCVLENSSVDSVLAGVAYDGLLYYNAETGVWETGVSTFEVFKGYWINVSGSDQVILEDSLVKQEIQEPPEPRPEIPVYEGWNAVGSDYEFDETAEKTLVSIDDSYSKIVDEYDVMGFNGENLEDGADGTINYMMHPYEGYWVFVTQDGILG